MPDNASPRMDRVEQYRRWFEFEKDSHDKVLDSLETVPAAARGRPEFQQAVDLLAHLAEARRLWLFRLGAADEGPKHLFPSRLTVAEAAARLEHVQSGWDRLLQTLDDGRLSAAFDYQSLEGERYRNRVEDVLTQLFGHSLYHRGQIALLVRTLGGQPAETDFIFWTRQELGQP